MKFSEFWEISGTRTELWERLDEPFFESERDRLWSLNKYIFSEARDNYKKFAQDLNLLVHGMFTINLDYVNFGFITNAADSITTMFSRNDPEYVGKISLELTAAADKVRFQVEDTGTGIDPAIEPYLFIQERRTTKSRTSKLEDVLFGGAGIHLGQAERILKYHDGEINFENKGQDKGAIFWYEVPLKGLKKVRTWFC